jgi:hypothetical protein
MEMLWYAAYGSTVNRERFLELIRGGRSQFDGATYPGCRNRQDPVRDCAITISREMYFGKVSTGWGGAVAFLRPEITTARTLGRGYLVTAEQFEDVACQLNGLRPGCPDMHFDHEYAGQNPAAYFSAGDPSKPGGPAPRWYGRILRLGARERLPIFAITGEWDGYGDLNAPGRAYVRCAGDGIRQLGRISHGALVEYFISRAGIHNRISRPVLERWLA